MRKYQVKVALIGFGILIFIMVFNIYLGQVGVTGASVVEPGAVEPVSGYQTAAVIVLALAIMGLFWLIYGKLKKT